MTAAQHLLLLLGVALAVAWRRGWRTRPALADLAALTACALLLWQPAPRPPAASERAGPLLALAVDVSTSMAAPDAAPNRLARARQQLRTVVTALPQARFALLPFAGEAVLQVPPTADREALFFFIDRLEPGQVAAPGSAPEEAVLSALQALSDSAGEKAVLLLSDGERTLSGRPPQLPTGVPIYAVCLGSAAGSPLTDVAGQPRYDADGTPLHTRADCERLARLATSSGGQLLSGSDDLARLAPLLERWGGTPETLPPALARWVAVLALLLLLARQLPRPLRLRGAWAGVALLALLAACRDTPPSPGARLFAAAQQMATQGEIEEAASAFAAAARQLDGAERGTALYNRGTLLLQAGQPQPALAVLEQALLHLPGDEEVRRNFVLALRAVGPERPPGVGEGDAPGTESGAEGMSREQALQLLEGVRPEPAAPTAANARIHETAPARDW